MAIVVPNEAEIVALNYILNKATPQDLDVRLFINDYIPTEADTAASFVEAPIQNGYNKIELTPNLWSVSPGTPSVATHQQISWIFTGAIGPVYGYYITRRITGDLIWAERFTNGPYNIQNNQDQIRLTPRLTAD